MSSLDSRGIRRGRCSVCSCLEYKVYTGLKCSTCGHPPGKHMNLSKESKNVTQHAAPERSDLNYAVLDAGTSNYNPEPMLLDYEPPKTGPCKATGCDNKCHYEESVGEFDYCSPGCRDKHLLPRERENLMNDLAAYEFKVKPSSSSLASGRMVGYQDRQPVGHQDRQTADRQPVVGQRSGGKQSYSAAVQSGQATHTPPISGGQKTFVEVIKSNLPKGLIVNDTSFGALVVGFECNTGAERQLTTSKLQLRLLDVITKINSREANSSTIHEEMQKSSCCLTIIRSVQFPSIDPLLKKAKYLKPTHVVVVSPSRSGKTYGLGTVTLEGFNIVADTTEYTPARVCGLQFRDEIIAYGFVMGRDLKVEKGVLENVHLENAAAEGKTLVLAIKRPE